MKSEFEFITNLKNKYSLNKIGDDCAVLPKDSKTDLVITTDLLVEDIDFRLLWTKPDFLGHKSLAVSLSDVAAMGGKPVWSMVSIGVPEAIWKTDFVEKFYEGYIRLARKFNVELIGGDVSKTPDKIVIDSIVAGEVKKGKAILRSGAKVGDLIFVSGELGGASGGLKLLMDNILNNEFINIWLENLISRQLQPLPKSSIGRRLGFTQIPSAMIDLSDGLSSDLNHLCRASQVGAKIYAEKIPIDSNLVGISNSFESRINYALNGGEDFELLFTVSPNIFFSRESFFIKRGFLCIGEVTANAEIIELITNGESRILESKGFRHF
ncbi:MAG TPA: thiamine-phosphate kinase [Pyrinomonadaceae bacterium]|nr:thiamine-phosphate kinase [Pyrinomonadaceae bacterium]